MRLSIVLGTLAFLLAVSVDVAGQTSSQDDGKKVSCKSLGGSCIDSCSSKCKGPCVPGKCTGAATRQCCVPTPATSAGTSGSASGGSKEVTDAEAVTVLVVIGVIVGGIALLVFGASRRCSACAKWWALEKIGTEELDRDHVYKVVPVNEQIVGRKGVYFKRTEQQRRFTRVLNRHVFRCKHCGHEEDKREVTEFQG